MPKRHQPTPTSNFREVSLAVYYPFALMTVLFWGFFALIYLWGFIEGPDLMLGLFYFVYIVPVTIVWAVGLSLYALITRQTINHRKIWWMPVFSTVGLVLLLMFH